MVNNRARDDEMGVFKRAAQGDLKKIKRTPEKPVKSFLCVFRIVLCERFIFTVSESPL